MIKTTKGFLVFAKINLFSKRAFASMAIITVAIGMALLVAPKAFAQVTLPYVNVTLNPNVINNGQSSVLSWSSQNATTCYGTGILSGKQGINGSMLVYPDVTTTYGLTCTNQYGQASDARTLTVNNISIGTARNVQVSQSILNRTLGQTSYSNSIEGQGLDVLEFEIRVRNMDNTSGPVNLQDIFPQEFFYVPNSTNINGISVADGITSGGISLGNINPNEEKIVRFRAVIFPGTPVKFITNQINATMNSGTQNAYATIQIRNRGQVLGVADIVTGSNPNDPLPWFLVLGFITSIAFYFAAFKHHVIELNK